MKKFLIHIVFILLPTFAFCQLFIGSQSSLKVDQNATFYIPEDITNQGSIQNEGTMQVEGNWTNNGTYAPLGTVVFQGYNQQVLQNGSTFYDVIITGGGNKSIPSRMYISHSLNLQNGFIIPVDTAKIIMLENATSTSGSNISFVKGTLYTKGTGSKYYPIGMNNLFLPAEFHDIIGTNPIIGISTHEFENAPIAGKGTREIFDNAYWKVEVLEGSYTDAKISVTVAPEFTSYGDSIVVSESIAPDIAFESIGTNPDYVSTIPHDYATSKDTAKGPIYALGVLLDINWDLLYIPNAISKHATNPEETCIKIYGGLFESEGFSFTITNQWGNKVFETISLNEMETIGWTGVNSKTKKRETTGQYFYYLQAIAKDKTPYSKAGSLWIID